MSISSEKAVEKVRHEIQTLGWADLREVYHELFPRPKLTIEAARQDPEPIRDQINKHIDRGLELDEIMSLWNLLFGVEERIDFYNEIDKVFQFVNDPDSVW
ncbi:MAG: hypothetical protein ACRELF_04400 [Gemmataceae bacterium]